MYFGKPASVIAAGNNKGKPSLIEITSAKVVVDDGTGKKIGLKYGTETYTDADGKVHVGIPAEQWEYPQFGPEPAKNEKGEYLELTEDQANDALDEMIKDAGGKVRLVENYNDATRTASLNKGKNFIRTKENVEPENTAPVIAEGLRLTKEFSWAQAERVTNKTVRESAEKLVEDLDALSPDEIKARLRAMVGR